MLNRPKPTTEELEVTHLVLQRLGGRAVEQGQQAARHFIRRAPNGDDHASMVLAGLEVLADEILEVPLMIGSPPAIWLSVTMWQCSVSVVIVGIDRSRVEVRASRL